MPYSSKIRRMSSKKFFDLQQSSGDPSLKVVAPRWYRVRVTVRGCTAQDQESFLDGCEVRRVRRKGVALTASLTEHIDHGQPFGSHAHNLCGDVDLVEFLLRRDDEPRRN